METVPPLDQHIHFKGFLTYRVGWRTGTDIPVRHGFSTFFQSAKNHYQIFHSAKKITTTKPNFQKKSLLKK